MRCFIYRIVVSHALDSGRALSRRVSRHVDRCPDCRQFHAAGRAVGDDFRASASDGVESWNPSLTGRIMEVIEKQGRPIPRRSVSNLRLSRPALAAACLALAVTLGMIFFNPADDASDSHESLGASIEAVSEIGQSLLGPHLTGESDTDLLALMTEPLTAEVDRLAEDAETMKGFVLAALPLNLLRIDGNHRSR